MRQRPDSDRYRGKRRAATPAKGKGSVPVGELGDVGVIGTMAVKPAKGPRPRPSPTGARGDIADQSRPRAAHGPAPGPAHRADIGAPRSVDSGLPAGISPLGKDDTGTRSDARSAGVTATILMSPQRAAEEWSAPLGRYEISCAYGDRWGILHPGVDLAVEEGTPYYAARAGQVRLARWNGGYGFCVIVDIGSDIEILYGHSSKLIAREGERVRTGDLLGLVGNTGYSFGSHLHFEVRIGTEPVDPVLFMRDHGVDLT